MIFSIYKISNLVNNKCYIGFSKNYKKRWKAHKRPSSWNRNANFKLYRAFIKYGISNFRFEVIYQSKDEAHTLNTMEPYFINLYNSFGEHGYNMTTGGEGNYNRTLSDITKQKISKKNFGKKRSPDQIKRMKDAVSAALCKNSYTIFYDDGSKLTVVNLLKFAKEFRYSSRCLYDLKNKKINKYKNLVEIITTEREYHDAS